MKGTTLRLAVAAVALAMPAVASADATLQVVGNGRVLVRPDLASVSVSVFQEKATRELARGRADLVAKRIIAGLTGLGISRPDIQTSNVALSSNTIRRHHHDVTVWDASIDLTINTTKIELLPGLFATASRDGAYSFQGPNYGFSNPSAGLPQATAAAIADARSRADGAAAALGEHVIGVQSVDLDPGVGVLPTPVALAAPPGAGAAPHKRSAPPTPTLPGLQTVDARVDIVFLIGP